MIEEIEFEGFESLEKVRLELGAPNLFIGANASGKSNFFDALRVLQGTGYGFTVSGGRMKLVAATLLCWLFVCPAVQSQVVARQGDPQESPLQEFKSPMILDLPLKDFPLLPFSSGKDFKEVRKYYCDDVVLSQLVLVKKKDSHRGQPPGVRMEIRGTVSVRLSYDRLVTLRFDAVKGEERFATAQVFHVNAEEGETTPFTAELRLAAEEVERLFAEGEPPVLRVTVAVADNS